MGEGVTTGQLVEKIRMMREHRPIQTMTVLFGVIFHDELEGRLQEVEKRYNERYEGTLNARDKLNCTNIRHGVNLAPYVAVNEDVLRKWR